jgi:AcrR family transcriptional regulator
MRAGLTDDHSIWKLRPIGRFSMARPESEKRASLGAILDCAEQLFAQRGFGGSGLAEVAERAGFAKSSLFHHFETKVQLYAAVMARLLVGIETELTRALAAGGPPTERLERWLDTLINVLAANPSYARLLLRTLFEDAELAGDLAEAKEANAALARIAGSAVRLVREGIGTGEFRAASAPHALHLLLGATVHHFATGRFGEELIGRPLFAPSEVRRHKAELLGLLRHGLIRVPGDRAARPRRRS